MSDLSNKVSCIREVLEQLKTFLLANMPSVGQVISSFPDPNQQLSYPAVSIFLKSPTYTNLMPYVIFKDVGNPDSNGQVKVQKVVGMYDFKLQLDLWSASKIERDYFVEELQQAFNKNASVPGISLQLTNYYNQWCHYSVQAINYMDAEEQSQRKEWRALVTVLANTRAVSVSMANLMTSIENNLSTPDSIDAPAASDDSSLII